MVSGSGIERRLTAILSADAVGYSRLMAAGRQLLDAMMEVDR